MTGLDTARVNEAIREMKRGIEGSTRVTGIFGDPVSHSLSPKMHNYAYEHLNLDYVYVPSKKRN
jgi:hypothetical protein